MTERTICRMLREILGLDESLVAPGTKLWRSVDAVSLARLFLACERHFKITIDDERAPGFHRVSDLAAYVDQRIKDGRDDYKLPGDRGREAWYYE